MTTDAEHNEFCRQLYGTLRCIEHCQGAILHAQRRGDDDLARFLEHMLAHATRRRRLLREVIADRARTRIASGAQRLDVGALVIDHEGRWFRLPSGRRVECGERYVTRRILICLALQRLRMPGQAVSVATLLAAGWPNEPMNTDSGKNRLRAVLVRLRRRGLRCLLQTVRHGYRLDPAVSVKFAVERAEAAAGI